MSGARVAGEFDDYIGRTRSRSDQVAATPVRLLASTLDEPNVHLVDGAEVPLLWHWVFFVPDEPQSELGPDGHPRRGSFLPDITLRRRMFGGGSVQQHQPLRVGDQVDLTEKVSSIERKEASSGPLWVVTVERVFTRDARLAITETQNILYTGAAPVVTPSHGEPPHADWLRTLRLDEPTLFRFSALTFNAHRIHYDHDYATRIEGYPGLVVHGPLIAVLLAELARGRGIVGTRFSFRARSPVFIGDQISLLGDPTDDGAYLKAYRGRTLAMEATVSV